MSKKLTNVDVVTGEESTKSLREIASNQSSKSIIIGAAVLPKPLIEERDYRETLSSEFNGIVIEHHLKWTPLCEKQPGPNLDGIASNRVGKYDFHESDLIVDWGLSHGMKIKGHVLVWHVTTPSFLEEMSAEELKEQVKRHIFTTMNHFRGRIKVWDVVNESLAPDGSLAENIFLKKLGPSYIEDAFYFAHEADPDAFLIYNDNKVEGIEGEKSEAFYNLLKKLKERGVPIHGAGIQAHFNAAGTGRSRVPTPKSVKEQIRRIGNLGLKVNISELDVRTSGIPCPERRKKAQSQIYHDILAAALSEPSFDAIWLWGFTDKHTWVKHFYKKGDEEEPLIFDATYRRKESYFAVMEALKTLTVNGVVGGNVLLDNDVDKDGNAWGHEWMLPEPEINNATDFKGDSRPDWLQS